MALKCCDTKIGHLNRRIAIQAPVRVSDSHGGFTETWSTSFSAWAHIIPASTSQRFFADKTEMEITHNITIRYTSSLMPPTDYVAYRVLYGTRVFHIQGIRNREEQNIWLDLECVEGKPS